MLRTSIIIAATALAVSPALAYVHNIDSSTGAAARWPGTSTNLWLDPNFRPGGGDQAAITDAVDAWNRTPIPFHINVFNAGTATTYRNGRNEVRWIDHKADIGQHPAETFWHYTAGVLDEADIVFALDWGFTDSQLKSQMKNYVPGGKRSLRGVATHELGHFLGLGHEADVYNIMGDDSTHVHVKNGDTLEFYPGEDATTGVRTVYGTVANRHDLSVSHWRWTGSSDGYSSHGRARVLDLSGNPLAVSTVDNEPYYTLTRGSSYLLESTLENLGSVTEHATVRYMLSTTPIITASATPVRTITDLELAPNAPLTYKSASFTLPTTLAPREYWLGVYVDPTNLIAETDETNNSAYIAKVRVQ